MKLFGDNTFPMFNDGWKIRRMPNITSISDVESAVAFYTEDLPNVNIVDSFISGS